MINPLPPNIPSIVAYVDAGTLTLIIQFAIGGAVAGFFFIRGGWVKTKAFFAKLFRNKRNKKNND